MGGQDGCLYGDLRLAGGSLARHGIACALWGRLHGGLDYFGDDLPPKIVPLEVFLITVFGIFSSLIASWGASRGILRMTVAEVMRDE